MDTGSSGNATTRMLVLRQEMNWIYFWIGALATYRITVFICRDKGPFGIFSAIRRIKILAEWAKCPFCVSPYVAAFVCVLFFLSGVHESAALWICIALSWSAVTIAIDRTFSSDVVMN